MTGDTVGHVLRNHPNEPTNPIRSSKSTCERRRKPRLAASDHHLSFQIMQQSQGRGHGTQKQKRPGQHRLRSPPLIRGVVSAIVCGRWGSVLGQLRVSLGSVISFEEVSYPSGERPSAASLLSAVVVRGGSVQPPCWLEVVAPLATSCGSAM